MQSTAELDIVSRCLVNQVLRSSGLTYTPIILAQVPTFAMFATTARCTEYGLDPDSRDERMQMQA